MCFNSQGERVEYIFALCLSPLVLILLLQLLTGGNVDNIYLRQARSLTEDLHGFVQDHASSMFHNRIYHLMRIWFDDVVHICDEDHQARQSTEGIQ